MLCATQTLSFASESGWHATSEKIEDSCVQNHINRNYEKARLLQSYVIFSKWVAAIDASAIDPNLIAKLLSNAEFVTQFAQAIGPTDQPANVFALLSKIYCYDAEFLVHYRKLALAIAVVHDESPPERRPHGQTGIANERNLDFISGVNVLRFRFIGRFPYHRSN